ncbi:heterogeneous nuclear ribonucleoprotein 27C-like [Mytilus californianus]|uniref:heterogeneous nuclear ribonucleoprotein 27C-like n=1 Tax=Mytilus californianus TaxID=6549 RepID=UPI0022457E2E|nr:heterogeneous nuclear ribonucleoprotein 27C-like [Mytilus californianus]
MADRRDDPGKFFVGNLSWETDNESLWNYFSKFGPLSDAVVIMDRETGRSRGFGFVTFRDPRNLDVVFHHQQQHEIDGRQVSAKPCNNR